MEYPTVLDKGFWQSPTCVFTGLTFMLVGLVIGLLLGLSL